MSTLRRWAIKSSELKPLSLKATVLYAARLAMRIETFCPETALPFWSENLIWIVDTAFNLPMGEEVRVRSRTLADLGAAACNRLENTPNMALGRCMNYATLTLANALEITTFESLRTASKAVIECAKYSASIPATLAHAGLIKASPGENPVDSVCLPMWECIRQDIAATSGAMPDLKQLSPDERMQALRAHRPLWPFGTPSWAVLGLKNMLESTP